MLIFLSIIITLAIIFYITWVIFELKKFNQIDKERKIKENNQNMQLKQLSYTLQNSLEKPKPIDAVEIKKDKKEVD